jgi:TFIIF-interacting CTD phosphatase-like protein
LWLRELLEPFVNTVFELLTNGDATSCILSFRDRSSKENDENGVRENGASTRDDESGKVLRKETKDTPPESLSAFVPVSDVTDRKSVV